MTTSTVSQVQFTHEPTDKPRLSLSKFAGAFIFAFIYVSIPWPQIFENVRGYPMVDRTNYARQIANHDLRSDYFTYDTWLSYVTEEFLWSELLKFLTREVGLGAELVFAGIAGFVIFVFAYLMLTKYSVPSLLLLVNPLVVDLAFSQLRIALAIAILGCLHLARPKNKVLVIVVIALCSMIHTTVPVFVLLYWLAVRVMKSNILRHQFAKVVLVAAGLMVALVLGPLRDIAFAWTEDRRLEYGDHVQSSALYLAFWVVLFIAVLMIRDESFNNLLETRYATVILALVVASLFFTGYPTRFLAAVFPILVIMIVELSKRLLGIPLLLFISYTIIQWTYWMGLV